MTPEAEDAPGRYIYAIIGDSDPGEGTEAPALRADRRGGEFPWLEECAGFGGRRVYPLAEGPVAAVVSDVPGAPLRPERRNLMVHFAVLKRLMAQRALLPLAFGTIADSATAVRLMLRARQEALSAQLERVDGKVEMELKVFWNVPNIFEHFARIHPQLGELRDKLFRHGHAPSPDEKIALGQLFDRMLDHERTSCAGTVIAALHGQCYEIKESRLRDERQVTNLACLIGRNSRADFEQAVCEAAKHFDDTCTFDIGGPFPPHNFVTMDLQLHEIRRPDAGDQGSDTHGSESLEGQASQSLSRDL